MGCRGFVGFSMESSMAEARKRPRRSIENGPDAPQKQQCPRQSYADRKPDDERALLEQIQPPDFGRSIQNSSAGKEENRSAQRLHGSESESHHQAHECEIRPTPVTHLLKQQSERGIGIEVLVDIGP